MRSTEETNYAWQVFDSRGLVLGSSDAICICVEKTLKGQFQDGNHERSQRELKNVPCHATDVLYASRAPSLPDLAYPVPLWWILSHVPPTVTQSDSAAVTTPPSF